MVEGFESVYVAQGEFEEHQVRSFLAAHDIPSVVRGEALRRTHALTLDGLGAVEILVPSHLAENARELFAQVDRGELTLGDDP